MHLFLFTLLAVSSILPSGLALPRRSSCPTSYGSPPSPFPFPPPLPSSSLPPNDVAPSLSPSPAVLESTSTPLPTTTSNPGSGSTPVPEQTYLDAHNAVRANHGASPLQWSDELASKAQQWAARCQFEHSGGQLGQFGGSHLKSVEYLS